MHDIFNQLQNMFSAMHFAEEGDLDSVRQILQTNPSITEEEERDASAMQSPALPAF
jgi:hypothetical protein